jgi:hypothetical protein
MKRVKKDPAIVPGFKYLAIKNWHKYQPDKKFRAKDASMPWIKDWTAKEFDADYAALGPVARYALDAMCRLAGRIGGNVPNHGQWIVTALAVPGQHTGNLKTALRQLVGSGFLVPTNQRLRNLEVQEVGGEGEGSALPLESEVETDLSVSQSVSQQKEPPADAGAALETGEEAEAVLEWADASTPVYDLPCWTPLHEEFGVVGDLPEAAVRDIHTVLKQIGADEAWMRGCAQFCFLSGFWKHRIVSAKAFAKALKNSLGGDDTDNKLVAQYNRYAKARRAAASGKR